MPVKEKRKKKAADRKVFMTTVFRDKCTFCEPKNRVKGSLNWSRRVILTKKTIEFEEGYVENENPYTFDANQLTPKRLTIINCGQKSE
jgi:hypothetical protein